MAVSAFYNDRDRDSGGAIVAYCAANVCDFFAVFLRKGPGFRAFSLFFSRDANAWGVGVCGLFSTVFVEIRRIDSFAMCMLLCS